MQHDVAENYLSTVWLKLFYRRQYKWENTSVQTASEEKPT